MKKLTALFLALFLLLGLGASALGADKDEPQVPTEDPSGAAIQVPDEIDRIVVLAPSLARIVAALGRGEQIVGYETNCADIEGLDPEAEVFDLTAPDMERLAALEADLVLVSDMTLYDQTEPFQQLIDLGVCVACVPNSESIEGIYEDIAFLAAVLGEDEAGQELADGMRRQLDDIAAVAETIPEAERRSVYFEISAAPYMYSFGQGVFLNELIELIGAENILADEEGWMPVEAETVAAADPDVILTSVDYIDDPVGEILSREGWAGVTAVAEERVYAIDSDASAQPCQNITVAAQQMAQAVYPEYFAQ